MRLIPSVLMVTLLSASGPMAAAERSIPYADMHSVFERVERLKGGQYLKPSALVSTESAGMPLADIRLTVRSRSGELRVPIDADGHIDFPVRADLLAENPPVVTNVPAGKFSVRVSLTVEAPPTQRFHYGLFVAMQDEADRLIAKQGLMARAVLPDFDGFIIQFPKGVPATATIESTKGEVVLNADAEGVIELPERRDWTREDPWVRLSVMPTRLALGID